MKVSVFLLFLVNEFTELTQEEFLGIQVAQELVQVILRLDLGEVLVFIPLLKNH